MARVLLACALIFAAAVDRGFALQSIHSKVFGNPPSEKFAIVTLVGGLSDFDGTKVLGCSLRDFAASYNIDLLAFCYDVNASAKKLAYKYGWTCIEPEQIPNPDPKSPWIYDYTMKIAPFSLTQYSRVLLLDSDMVAVNAAGLMALFKRPLQEGHIMASLDCGSQFAFEKQHGHSYYQLQPGAIVLQPSKKMHRELKAAAPTTFSLDGRGQGFVSEFFKGKVQWLEAKFSYVRSSHCVGLLNETGYYDVGDGTAEDAHKKVHKAMSRGSRDYAEKRARRDVDNNEVVFAHFQLEPKPWYCDKDKRWECGYDHKFCGTTRINVLYDAWLAVAETCI